MDSSGSMPHRRFIFLDEAGNFDFARRPGASRYFVLTSVTLDDCRIGEELTALRRELAWDGVFVNGCFHATEDLQVVRDRVFELIGRHEIMIDATVIEKAKAMPHLAADKVRFYKTAMYQHLKHVIPLSAARGEEVMVVCASLGTKREQMEHVLGIEDVLRQVAWSRVARHGAWPAESDPCLQIADYCCWAIQRKWEHTLWNGQPDTRSYDLIKGRVRSEFELFRLGTTLYY